MKAVFNFPLEEISHTTHPVRCVCRKDWDKAGHEGDYFGNVLIDGRNWALVLWDGEEDPDLYKSDALILVYLK